MTLQTPIVVPYCYQVTGKRLCEDSRLPSDATGHRGGPSRLPGSIPIKVVPLPLAGPFSDSSTRCVVSPDRDFGSCYLCVKYYVQFGRLADLR
ncbi:hypothetical protein AVEN_25635-1 [Araneus ventricosus]|uniref:Uncharacterized protein n=1 Tax=Araneus ventricosus TaxID=182803 RepID=A0A4Y2BN55_ARAVE|nr:hypothetical protein AVEN_25635-1 [Araneus ventricosus]